MDCISRSISSRRAVAFHLLDRGLVVFDEAVDLGAFLVSGVPALSVEAGDRAAF